MHYSNRLLNPELLPKSLWDETTETLLLPPALSLSYKKLIKKYQLEKLADKRDPQNPPVGGLDQKRTDEHFAQAFDGSVARTQLALLDPKKTTTAASNAFIEALTGNKVSLTDAPCGAAAASLAYLTTIAELRVQKVLPRLPLDVYLIGAEISDLAINYARQLFEEINDLLEQQAIFVKTEFLSWNVTDKMSTTNLIKQMTVNSTDASQRLLVIANFNGFLEKERKRKDAAPQIEELFRHAAGPNSVAVWIEPNMNRATGDGGLFSWIKKNIKTAWRFFVQAQKDDQSSTLTSSAQFYLPLDPSKTAKVRLAVMRLDLEPTT